MNLSKLLFLVKNIHLLAENSGVLTLNKGGMIKFELNANKISTREIVNKGNFKNFVTFSDLAITYFFDKTNKTVFLLDQNDYINYIGSVQSKDTRTILKIQKKDKLIGIKMRDTLIQLSKVTGDSIKKPQFIRNFEFLHEGTDKFRKVMDFEIIDSETILALVDGNELIMAKNKSIMDHLEVEMLEAGKIFLNEEKTTLYILGRKSLESEAPYVMRYSIKGDYLEENGSFDLSNLGLDMVKEIQFIQEGGKVFMLINSVNSENFSNKVFFLNFDQKKANICKIYEPEIFSKTALYYQKRLWNVGINSILYRKRIDFLK